MIVRILGEGQWKLDQEAIDQINALDDKIGEAVVNDDQDELTSLLGELAVKVREVGEILPDDDLRDSDLILPDSAASVADVRAWLDESGSEDGLIPG